MSDLLTSSVREITIPYRPRNWAKKLHNSFLRWAVLVLHRRAGKTTAILNHHQRAALDTNWAKSRLNFLLPSLSVGELLKLTTNRVYWHVMPTFHQGKVTGAWDILKDISRVVPGVRPNESEMLIKYPNRSQIRIVGADDADSLRGPGLSGLSLDEYSDIPPNAFGTVLSKALADHLGYAIFAGTIKGADQLHAIYEASKSNRDWFALWQNVDVSLATEEGATIKTLEAAMIDDQKMIAQGLMTQDDYDQEWYLSIEAALKGTFYAKEMKVAREGDRFCRVPFDPALPVDTDWDLGIDAMAIWFSQSTRAGEVRLIDYHEDVGGGLPECIKALRGQAGTDGEMRRRSQYTYGEHWGPHDIEVREISTAMTRRQAAAALGVKFQITPKIEIADGITAARLLFARCYFDETNAKRGIECLRNYRKTWQPSLNQFSAKPVHDWASHGADAFRGLAVRHRVPREKKQQEQPREPIGQWS